MRTLLKISAIVLVGCAGWSIASRGDSSTSGQSTSDQLAVRESVSGDLTASDSILTTSLESGRGIVSTPNSRSGYLIITSTSPEVPETGLEISRPRSLVADSVSWAPLTPLTILHSRENASQRLPPSTREVETISAELPESPAERTFYLHVTDGSLNDPRQYVAVQAQVIAEGEQVRVYLDRQRKLSPRIRSTAQRMIETLEQQIIPPATREVGFWDDVDGDGKLSVLLTPWLDRLQGGKTSLKGFVRASDFRPYYPAPFGNQADVIYFNSEVAADVNLLTLLAHEYWHILQCSYRLSLPDSPLPLEADWISEGTAHLAELHFGGGPENLAHRINDWLASPESAPLVVDNYYSAGLWRHDGCRGASFLFFQWCEQWFGGDLGTRLLRAPRSGDDNLKRVTGADRETLQMQWTISMLEETLASERSGEGQTGPRLLTTIPAFEHVPLNRLCIHEMNHSGRGEERVTLKIAPTATCYVHVESGMWRIQTEKAIPLRVTFSPDTLSDESKRLEKQRDFASLGKADGTTLR